MKGLKARKCKHCGEQFKPTNGRQIYCKAKKCSRERKYKYWLAYIQEWKKRRPTYYVDYLRKWRARNPSYWKEWRRKNPGWFKAWYRKRRLRALQDRQAQLMAKA